MPGWQAAIRRPGGASTALPVLRADLTFLAIPVPAGSATVDLSYRPASVRFGLYITSATLLLLLALAVYPRLRARRALSAGAARTGTISRPGV